MRLHRSCLLVLLLLILPLLAPSAYADGILGSDLLTFALLGGAGVAINGTGSVISGSVGGCCMATAVTGTIPTNFTISGGTVQMGGATATSAQGQLGAAITALNGTTTTGSISGGTLGGLTLPPGVYSSSAAMNLTGTLTLDGGGNANALWVFLGASTLITASSSVVNVINTGSGAGVYWVLPTVKSGDATLGSNSVFAGNILANDSITVGTNVTDSCGRLLTQVASVTLAGTDTIGIGCSGTTAGTGSNGFSGGGTITTKPGGGGTEVIALAPAPVGSGGSAVPEPGTLLLLGIGIAGLAGKARMRRPKVLRA